MADIKSTDSFRLHSGDLIPYFGYGTAGGPNDHEKLYANIENALATGHRLFDTAEGYGNEQLIGDALKVLLPKYNLTRKDIFITTKFNTRDAYGEEVAPHLEQSLKRLGTFYVDMYLIHHPGLYQRDEKSSPKSDKVLRDETWKQMVDLYKKGLVRNIGVSNYTVKHLKELLKNNHGVRPSLNQVEWNPGHYDIELLRLCKREGILVQAWSPLGGKKHSLLGEEPIVKIAEKLNKTPAQIILRWALEQGVGVISKSSSQERLVQNRDINFTIPQEDMNTIFSMTPKPPNPKQDPDTII